MLYVSRLSTTLTRSLIRHASLVRLDHHEGLRIYPMLYVVVYHINTKLDTSCIASQARPPRGVDASLRCGNISVKCFSLTHNDPLLSSGIEPGVDNFSIADLRSYPLRCTAAFGRR